MLHGILSKATTGKFAHLLSCVPLGPQNDFGPVVSPSNAWNKCWNGSSLKCSRHTPHCNGFFTCSSMVRMTPVFPPVFVTVPSHPITSRSSNESPASVKWVIILLAILWADPVEGDTWPTYTEPRSCIIEICSSIMVLLNCFYFLFWSWVYYPSFRQSTILEEAIN